MGFKFTILLLILNVLVLAGIFTLNSKSELKKDIETIPKFILGSKNLDADTIEIITSSALEGITSDLSILLTKEREQWVITHPIKWNANFHAVNKLLNQLQFLEKEVSFPVEEVVKSGQSLSDYGLEKPKIILKISSLGKTISLKVGLPTEIGNQFYLLGPDEENIYIVQKQLLEGLNLNLEQLRNPQVFDIPIFEISSLGISSYNQDSISKVSLTNDEQQWKIQTPIQVDANSAKVQTLLNDLTSIKSKLLTHSSSNETGVLDFQNPIMKITLEGNNRRQELLVGKELESNGKKAHYAKLESSDTAFIIDAAIIDSLNGAQEKLRDKKLFKYNPSDIDIVEYSSSTDSFTLKKVKADSWQVIFKGSDEALQSKDADNEAVNNLITGLLEVSATRFITDAPSQDQITTFGLDKPNFTFSLSEKDKKYNLTIGSKTNETKDLYYAKANDQSYVYSIEEGIFQFQGIDPLAYLNKNIDKLPPVSSIRSMKVFETKTGEERVSYIANQGKESESVEVTGKNKSTKTNPEENENILALIKELKTFNVESIISNEFIDYKDPYGEIAPWKYKLELVIELPGGQGVQVLTKNYFFTERLGGITQIGGSPELNILFKLKQSTIDLLHALVFDRQLPPEYRPPLPTIDAKKSASE